MPAKIRQYEDLEQQAVVSRAKMTPVSGGPLSRFLLAIPNGSHLAGDTKHRAIKMARLKALGLRPGASDLLLALQHGPYAGLFIEMKKQRGHFPSPRAAERAFSDDQRLFHRDAGEGGFATALCYGAAEADLVISQYLSGDLDWERWNP